VSFRLLGDEASSSKDDGLTKLLEAMVGGGGSLCRWLAVVAGDSGAVGRKREGTENGKRDAGERGKW
jgi:hypothetical protein